MTQATAIERSTRRLSAVLFVDVVDSVRLISENEEGTVARWRSFVNDVLADDLPAHRGRMVKHTGDGMLVEFDSVLQCVMCAIAMQRRMELANTATDAAPMMHVRMGVHVADVIADDVDLYGEGVNVAARLMSLGGGREIVISSTVRDQLSDGLGVAIEDLGERVLKGMSRPVHAFRAWPVDTPPTARIERALHGDRPSIAVLPFRNLSADHSTDFMGDLLAEDVIGRLSRMGDLFVISRLSTSAFRDPLYTTRNVGEALGVRYVLTGSVFVANSRMHVTAELTEAHASHVEWSDKFSAPVADIFEMHEALAFDIAKRLMPHVRKLELRRAKSKSLETLSAYERMLRGVDYLHRSARESMPTARILLQGAIEREPGYAAPYAWLAHWHVRQVSQGWSRDGAFDTREARRLADSAVERDETSSLALAVRGLVTSYLDKDLEAGNEYLNRALEINPSESLAWVWSTSTHAWLGIGDEAVNRCHRAIELSPFDPRMYTFTSIAGTAHAVAGNYDKAIDYCRQSLRLNRMYASSHRILALSLALAGRTDEAREAASGLLQVEPGLTVEGFRARYPGNKAAHVDAFCEGLAKAGVPRR
jgi:adenylate cyclase